MADLYSRKLMAPRGSTRLSYCGTDRRAPGDFLSVSRPKAKIHAQVAAGSSGSHQLSLSDYVALTKPKITPLLLMAAVGSEVVAARGIPPPQALAGVLLGGALASSGALALNSYLEMGMDA